MWLFLQQNKYNFLYKFYDKLSDIELINKLDTKSKYRIFPLTLKYNVKALRCLKKYMFLLTYQVESNKMNKAVLCLIKDVDSLSIYKTDFEKLKSEYESEIDDISDIEIYYNILDKNTK